MRSAQLSRRLSPNLTSLTLYLCILIFHCLLLFLRSHRSSRLVFVWHSSHGPFCGYRRHSFTRPVHLWHGLSIEPRLAGSALCIPDPHSSQCGGCRRCAKRCLSRTILVFFVLRNPRAGASRDDRVDTNHAGRDPLPVSASITLFRNASCRPEHFRSPLFNRGRYSWFCRVVRCLCASLERPCCSWTRYNDTNGNRVNVLRGNCLVHHSQDHKEEAGTLA